MMTWSIAWWWLVRTPLYTLSARPGPRHEALGHSKYSPIQCLMKRYTSAALAMFPDQLRWHERYRRAFVELQSTG